MIRSRHSTTVFSLLTCLAFTSTASGCSPMSFGQGRTVSFNVGGFKLPSAMAYSTTQSVQNTLPQIAKSADAARTLVRNLVMEAVIAVLEQQGRSALLPSFVISAILDQLTVTVNYNPLECPMAYTTTGQQQGGMKGHCFIIDNIVTVICEMQNCNAGAGTLVSDIPSEHLMISGSVRTTNLIMAGWSNQIWQSVFSRALQMMRQGPFATNFAGAFVTVM